MDAVSEVADAMGALGVDNGASQKFLPKDSPDSEELADVALSGESEVINPSEEVGGEATSPSEDIKSQPEDIKARVPKVRACHVDTFVLAEISYRWFGDNYVLSAIFMCSREARAGPLRLPNHSARAHGAAIRVKLRKTLRVLRPLRHPLHECLIQI